MRTTGFGAKCAFFILIIAWDPEVPALEPWKYVCDVPSLTNKQLLVLDSL